MRRCHHSRQGGTLGIFLSERRLLYLNCEYCGHRAQQDVLSLIAAHGEGFPLQYLVDRARCSQCGQRNFSVTAPLALGKKGNSAIQTSAALLNDVHCDPGFVDFLDILGRMPSCQFIG
jgi:hypothetical protein